MPSSRHVLVDRIYEFDAKVTGYVDGRLLAGCVRDEAGAIIAGFSGYTWGGCCELSSVWVHEQHRGGGLGTLLLRSDEVEAGYEDVTDVKVFDDQARA